MPDSFPRDLIAEIFSLLSDDPATLKTCSTINWNWFHESRVYIFRTITLNIHSEISYHPSRPPLVLKNSPHLILRRINLLHDCLTRSPHLVAFVRVLEIRNISATAGSDWKPVFHSLASFLDRLDGIQRFSLHDVAWSTNLEIRLQASIVAVLAQPSIQHTEFVDCAIHGPVPELVNLAALPRNLKSLKIHGVHFRDPHRFQGWSRDETTPQRVPLTTLTLHVVPMSPRFSWLTHPDSPIDLTSLSYLSINSAEALDEQLVTKIIDLAAPSLQHLDLHGRAGGFHQLVIFPSKVRTLSLHCHSHVGILHSMLATTTTPFALELLFISILTAFIDPLTWERLDTLLTQPNLHSLRKVTLHLQIVALSTFSPELHFPRLSQTGVKLSAYLGPRSELDPDAVMGFPFLEGQ